MRPIATDGLAWSACVSVSVCLHTRLNWWRCRLLDRLGWTEGTMC